ncbi:ferredoxin [Vagococcus carniphilus]|uniref:ferredoxin n=1 Tax=Vagococcus carniphilus TaxID=218144 RepID=UPI0028909277|nr:ferredoxin [Vagococcus carniphilus]MDT2815891.1 ferredoxin [Vagococcus carniphilus]MDT2865112.1 ferredoxin [Vagococcus carniphilus]
MLCKIIPNKCIACGLCQIKAPDIFDYHDNGIVLFAKTTEEAITIPDDVPEDILEAYKACPTRAIILEK